MVLMLVPQTAQAQKNKQEMVTVKGVVEDALGPIIGASVSVRTSRVSVPSRISMAISPSRLGPMMYCKSALWAI